MQGSSLRICRLLSTEREAGSLKLVCADTPLTSVCIEGCWHEKERLAGWGPQWKTLKARQQECRVAATRQIWCGCCKTCCLESAKSKCCEVTAQQKAGGERATAAVKHPVYNCVFCNAPSCQPIAMWVICACLAAGQSRAGEQGSSVRTASSCSSRPRYLWQLLH